MQMTEIVVALIHFAGDLLIGLLIAAGFGVVLITWLIPLIGAHPILTALIVMAIGGVVKARLWH
jgi:hypothetical protein